MLPEVAHYALVLALLLSALQCILPLYGTFSLQSAFIAAARPLALGQAGMVGVAFVLLLYAFVANDFSVAYVALNSNTHLPLFYRMAALWGAHEGSLLLWVMILDIWTVLVCFLSQGISAIFRARVLAVMGGVSFGFLLFMLLTSNPFARYLPNPPFEGNDLNPLLQDIGLATHPPMLYMGYVGMSIAFSFALAALMAGKCDAAWARWSLPWTIAAWCFLTLGIVLGSWWAYRDLGWGGWWFWDPVENASFMPWLASTALIHSLIVTEKRGAFKNWTVLLAIIVFILSILGTFLVRSGILTSVHAFAVDPTRGAFLLQFLAAVVLLALTLYAWRAPVIGQGGHFHWVSRESLLLINNLLLVVMMATVLLGTLYPLVLQTLGIAKISVGPPYFNLVFVPFVCGLLFFMGLAPACRWQSMPVKLLIRRVSISFFMSVIAAFLLPWWLTQTVHFGVVLGLGLALWVITTTVQDFFWRLRCFDSFLEGLKNLPQRKWAMVIAHLGMAVSAIGITLTTHYADEQELSLHLGESASVGSYQLQLEKIEQHNGPNYQSQSAHFKLSQKNTMLGTIVAEKHYYLTSQMVMTLPGIAINPWRDLYLALGEETQDHKGFELRWYEKPFVRWIWIGGFMMVLGGIMAVQESRKKK